MKLDVIAVIDACYAPIPDDRAWAARVLEALSPAARGGGLVAYRFDLADPCAPRLRPLATWGPFPNWFGLAPGTWIAPPELARGARRVNAAPAPFPERATTPDAIGLVAAGEPGDPGGSAPAGLLLALPVPAGRRLPPRLRAGLARIAGHLAAARRLRRLLLPADSRASSLRLDAARAAARRLAPADAADLWRGVVDGRWSLVDRAVAPGKLLLVARRNAPGGRDPKALSPPERDVVACAARGDSNKLIAWRLGVAAGTVAKHLRVAQAKLGVATRRELIATFGGRGA